MYEYISQDDIHIMVGENAKENDHLTKSAHPDDWWMHVVDTPGAHVVIVYNKDAIPEETVNDAAAIAVHHSKAKTVKKVVVHVTRAGHVLPGKHTGQVNVIEISRVKNIFTHKERVRMERLLKDRVHNKTWNTNSGILSCFGGRSYLST
jgi:predicted ribosome quality control (RQC) complex YloA/Tae2 family protein